jgi:hypothetical protein
MFRAGKRLREGTPDSIREKVSPRFDDFGSGRHLEYFESGFSVRRRHQTDMLDNHYKTSMSVK